MTTNSIIRVGIKSSNIMYGAFYRFGWIFFILLIFSNIGLIFPAFSPQGVVVHGQQQLSSTLTAQTNDRPQHLIEITAGKIQNFSFRIDLSNRSQGIINYQQPITDIAVFISSQSSSVKIIGPTTWSLPRIDTNSSRLITTKVYASPSIIGNPVFFTVTLQYIKNGQELKIGTFDLGAVVTGDISLEANNLAIRYVGDTPNLVGNLLNKGNTGALFTNLQVLSVITRPSGNEQQDKIEITPGASQFLGTIPPNTPTPFTIPISVVQDSGFNIPQLDQSSNITNRSLNNNETNIAKNTDTSISPHGAINYNVTAQSKVNQTETLDSRFLVSFKITYSDELTNGHELIVNRSIPYGLADSDTASASAFNNGLMTSNGQSSNLLPNTQYIMNNGFVDAYWAENVSPSSTNNSSSGTSSTITSAMQPIQNQREVGPGEGPAILAVVLTNTAFSDITGITGYLSLPPGFSSLMPGSSSNPSNSSAFTQTFTKGQGQGSNFGNNFTAKEKINPTNPAIATISDIVKAGQSYTLFFKVNILKTASIGPHTAFLRTYYFKNPDPEIGTYRIQTAAVPFVLAGKVVLDTSSTASDLIPGEVNHVKIQLRNKGTADANNVLVTLYNAGGSIITSTGSLANNDGNGNLSSALNTQQEASSLGSRIFNLGTLAAGSTAEINAAILPSYSSGESLQNLNLQLSYTDATGETRSSDEAIGFRVLPNPPEAGLAVNPNIAPQQQIPVVPNATSSIKETSNLTKNTDNTNGNAGNSGLTVVPSKLSEGQTKTNYQYVGIKSVSTNINNTGPASNKTINLDYYNKVRENGNGTIAPLTNPSKYSYKRVAISDTPLGVQNEKNITKDSGGDGNQLNNAVSRNDNNYDNSITITAGKVSNLNFTITNNNRYPILDAVVSLASQSSSISISGPSKWNLQKLDPGAHQFFPTSVFASTSIIGNPASFQVGIQYIMNGGARNDTFTMGAKVIGEISVDVSNLAISNIAGTPNLVGNLLNKGNTIALFTTIQLLSHNNITDQNQSTRTGKQSQLNTASTRNPNLSTMKDSSPSSSNRSSRDLVPASSLPSYLGDLDANSPLPFSIPLILQNNSSPGKYPVSLKVTYSDDLRANHELIINDSVDVSSRRQRPGSNSGEGQGIMGILTGKQYSLQLGGISIPIPIILIIIAILLAVLIISKRRKRASVAKIYATSKSKEEKFFLDEKGNKDLSTISTHRNVENEKEKSSGIKEGRKPGDTNEEVENSKR